MDKDVLLSEQEYLRETENILRDKIVKLSDWIDNSDENFNIENKKYLESLKTKNLHEISDDNYFDITYMQSGLENFADLIVDRKNKLQVYRNMCDTPYFARIDLQNNQLDCEKYYIGIGGIETDKGYRVIDWRSPVASVYYDYTLGDAVIHNPQADEKCKLLNKRQFRIDKGNLKYYIDTNLSIEDELLQDVLSNNSSSKMRSIVETIQGEQNSIIRRDIFHNIIVNGVAGSGKTALAMHRVAYILYRQKDKIKSKNILMLCPNSAFASYLSMVLPNLNEQDIKKINIDDYASETLRRYAIVEPKYTMIERAISFSNEYKVISYKYGVEFYNKLKTYMDDVLHNIIDPQDIVIKDVVVEKEFIARLFDEKYADKDLFTKIDWTADSIIDSYFFATHKKEKLLVIKKQLISALMQCVKTKNCVGIYQRFLKSINMPLELNGKMLKNEDVYGLLYVYLRLFGCNEWGEIKHVVIDEMQDYSRTQLAILNILFDCTFTMLGDYTQSIFSDVVANNFEDFIRENNGSEYIEINKTYRPTKQIAEFYNHVAKITNVKCFDRSGERVRFTSNNTIQTISNIIDDYIAKGLKRIAVITFDKQSANDVYLKLQKYAPTLLDETGTTNIDNAVCVSSVYVSKGLEFDGVIVYNASKNVVKTDLDYSLLYIACSRALHRLDVLSDGEFCDRVNSFIGEKHD